MTALRIEFYVASVVAIAALLAMWALLIEVRLSRRDAERLAKRLGYERDEAEHEAAARRVRRARAPVGARR